MVPHLTVLLRYFLLGSQNESPKGRLISGAKELNAAINKAVNAARKAAAGDKNGMNELSEVVQVVSGAISNVIASSRGFDARYSECM